MNDNKLSESLLKLDGSASQSPSDARRQVDRILRRHNLWIRVLTGLTIFFSSLAACGICSLFYVFYVKFCPSVYCTMKLLATEKDAAQIQECLRAVNFVFYVMASLSIWLGSCSVIALMLAVFCALFLIFVSRRAALHQVNTSLIALSEQLRQFQQELKNKGT